MKKLTSAEEDIMVAVWKTGEANIKSFMEKLEAPIPPYTTVASTFKNLEKKGFLSSRLVGNTYLYKAEIGEEEYKKNFMSGVVKNHFSNSYKDLVNFFVDQKKLSSEELKEIIRMIDKDSDNNSNK